MADDTKDPRKKPPAAGRTRRLWSLPAARAAHGATAELPVTSRTLSELSWLLLVLVLAYVGFAHRELASEYIVSIFGASLVYAASLVALQAVPGLPPYKRWAGLGRCLAMTGLITWVLWHAGVTRGPLINLYYLVIISSAVTLNVRSTVLNLSLITLGLVLLGHPNAPGANASSLAGTTLFLQLGPMLLVAYVTTRLANDIRKALERIRFISETDELTRLYNLRAFMQIAERLHRQAKRYSHPYALLMIDSDNLKSVNDQHGHACGNELLKITTNCIRRELRETDVAARYGGDEFIVLLPETGPEGARELSERIRRSVAAKRLLSRGAHVGTTVSIGVASFPDHGAELRSILNKADQAMYLSKRTGRDKVTLYDPG